MACAERKREPKMADTHPSGLQNQRLNLRLLKWVPTTIFFCLLMTFWTFLVHRVDARNVYLRRFMFLFPANEKSLPLLELLSWFAPFALTSASIALWLACSNWATTQLCLLVKAVAASRSSTDTAVIGPGILRPIVPPGAQGTKGIPGTPGPMKPNGDRALLSKLAENSARQSRKHSIIHPLASCAEGRLAIRKCCC